MWRGHKKKKKSEGAQEKSEGAHPKNFGRRFAPAFCPPFQIASDATCSKSFVGKRKKSIFNAFVDIKPIHRMRGSQHCYNGDISFLWEK